MKAIYINETGGTDVLIYGDRPEPEIAPGEILIRVGGSALNHLDLNLRAGNCNGAFPTSWGATWPARWCRSAPTPAPT